MICLRQFVMHHSELNYHYPEMSTHIHVANCRTDCMGNRKTGDAKDKCQDNLYKKLYSIISLYCFA